MLFKLIRIFSNKMDDQIQVKYRNVKLKMLGKRQCESSQMPKIKGFRL